MRQLELIGADAGNVTVSLAMNTAPEKEQRVEQCFTDVQRRAMPRPAAHAIA